jgi:hypothetical protein
VVSNPSLSGPNRQPERNGQSVGHLRCDSQETTQLELKDTQNDWLPPRRELPFPKPRDSNRGQSSPAPDLPPLPKPTPVQQADSPEKTALPANKGVSMAISKPVKKRVAQRKPAVKKPSEAKVSIAKRPDVTTITESGGDREAGGQEDEPSPLAAKSGTARPPSAASGLQSKVTATKKRSAPARPSASSKKPKMVDQSTQTQTLSGRQHTIALASTSNNVNSAPTATEESPAPPPQSYLDLVDTFIKRHQSGPAPKELWERPGYEEADEEQRQMMLNEFICENLENSEFLQLCADTEKAWRRIGFGM